MELPLSFDDFQALRGRARGRTTAVRSATKPNEAAAYDPRKSGQLTPLQTDGMEALQRASARSLGAALQARLEVPFELTFASLERLNAAEFLEGRGTGGYWASLGVPESPVALTISSSLALYALDRLLGGSGKESIAERPLTLLDNQILQPIGRLVGSEMQAAWQPLLNVKLPISERAGDAVRKELGESADRLLVVRFEARFQELSGDMVLALSSAIWTALLRRFAAAEQPAKNRVPQNSDRLREKLLNGAFAGDVRLPRSNVSLRQLSALCVGDVVSLQVRASEPLEVYVADRHMFLAAPVACGDNRGAQVRTILPIAPKSDEEETP